MFKFLLQLHTHIFALPRIAKKIYNRCSNIVVIILLLACDSIFPNIEEIKWGCCFVALWSFFRFWSCIHFLVATLTVIKQLLSNMCAEDFLIVLCGDQLVQISVLSLKASVVKTCLLFHTRTPLGKKTKNYSLRMQSTTDPINSNTYS